jgi:hypothetical protein
MPCLKTHEQGLAAADDLAIIMFGIHGMRFLDRAGFR